MLIWDDTDDKSAQKLMQDLAGDASTNALNILKRGANIGYKIIMAELGRDITEKTQTATTRAPSNPVVKSDRDYQTPPDFLFMKSLTLTIGGIKYSIQEEESQELWDLRTSELRTGIPELFFIKRRWGFSGDIIQLHPIPSAASNTLEMIYEAGDKDLSQNKYTAGTVTFTNGSASVAGVGTTWTSKMLGRYIQGTAEGSDGLWYRIVNVTSSTALTLENVYEGATLAGTTYQIAEIFSLPEELHELPCFYGLFHYFEHRQKPKQAADYFKLFTNGLLAAKIRYGTKSRGNIIRPKNQHGFMTSYPGYFPSSGVSS